MSKKTMSPSSKTYLFHQTLAGKLEFKADESQVLFVEAFNNTEIILHRNTQLTLIAFLTKGWKNLSKLQIKFEGENSEFLFLAFIVGSNSNQFLFETDSIHISPHTKAKYLVKAAMFDQSSVDYKGNLIIRPEAFDTDTYLAHHTLLLSPDARTKTIPALEIEADEVKAGHAATLGKVDEDLMFYLMTRGIEPKEAEKMLIEGFFEDQLALIDDPQLRAKLQEDLLQALPLRSLVH